MNNMQHELKTFIERVMTASFFWLFFVLYVQIRNVDVVLPETFIGFIVLSVAVPFIVRLVNNRLNG